MESPDSLFQGWAGQRDFLTFLGSLSSRDPDRAEPPPCGQGPAEGSKPRAGAGSALAGTGTGRQGIFPSCAQESCDELLLNPGHSGEALG